MRGANEKTIVFLRNYGKMRTKGRQTVNIVDKIIEP